MEPGVEEVAAADCAEVGTGSEGVAPERFGPLRLGGDGALTRDRAERFAMALVELGSIQEAWKAAGGKNSGGHEINDRKAVLVDPAFLARFAMLVEQRATDLAQGPHGEALWAARQSFRMARIAGDTGLVLRCAELMARIAEKVGGPAGEGAPAAEGAARPPGRPASEPKASRVDMGRIRGDLERLGLAPEAAG